MKSQEQINKWYDDIQWAHAHRGTPEALRSDVNMALAEEIWQAESATIHCYRAKILQAIDTPERLRAFLEFEAIDDLLWSDLSVLLFSLIQRNDISNVDFVIGRICDFVKMSNRFHDLRFATSISKAKTLLSVGKVMATDDRPDEET